MRKTMRLTGLLMGAMLALAACSDDDNGTGPGDGTLTPAEQAALNVALTEAGTLQIEGIPPEYIQLVLDQFESYGSAGDFDAAGAQVMIIAHTPLGVDTAVFSGVAGWKNLDVAEETVDEAISISARVDGVDFPSGGTFTEANATINTHFFDRDPAVRYDGSTGELVIQSAAFGGDATDCADPGLGVQHTCTMVRGEMAGTFEFTAPLVLGDGEPEYDSGLVSYNVPAVRMTIEVQLGAVTAGAR